MSRPAVSVSFVVQLVQLITHSARIAACGKKGVQDKSRALLKVQVAMKTRSKIRLVENRQRVLEKTVARCVHRRILPGRPVSWLSAAREIQPTLTGAAGHETRIFGSR